MLKIPAFLLMAVACLTGYAIAGTHPNVLMLIVDDMNEYAFYNTYPGIQMPIVLLPFAVPPAQRFLADFIQIQPVPISTVPIHGGRIR